MIRLKAATLTLTFLALALVVFTTACISEKEQAPESVSESASAYTVSLVSNEALALGSFLVDGKGMTLYYFANDVPGSGTSTCYDVCAERWPPFYAEELVVPTELDAADFSVITREDGSPQTTYRGWPLYYYFQDEAPGDAKGQGVGDIWFVINPQTFPPE